MPLPGFVVVGLTVVVNVVGVEAAVVEGWGSGTGSGSEPQFCSTQYEFPVMKVQDEDRMGF